MPPDSPHPQKHHRLRRSHSLTTLHTDHKPTSSFTMHPSPPRPPLNPSAETAASIASLGEAIVRMGRNTSTSSIASSEASQPAQQPLQPPRLLSSTRESLVMKQAVPLLTLVQEPTMVFKVRDDRRNKRLKIVYPGPEGPELLVVDPLGRPIWSVRERAPGVKVLKKIGSNYFILLHRRHWVMYLHRLVHAVAYRYGTERLVFKVKGDALGRRFWVYAGKNLITQMKRDVVITGIRSVGVDMAVWNMCVEPEVDIALMAAVAAVLEKWTVGEDRTERADEAG